MARWRLFAGKSLSKKFGHKKSGKKKPPTRKQHEDHQQDHVSSWVGFFNTIMLAVLMHPRTSPSFFNFPMDIMSSWFATLRFLSINRDFKFVVAKKQLNFKVMSRSPLKSYISLEMEDIMIYDHEADNFKRLKLLSGNEGLHVTLSYCCNFGNYTNLHKKAYRARSFLGGLEGDEVWASTRIYFSNQYIGLRILPTSDLYGILSNLSDIFEEDYCNYHVTVYTFN